PVLPQCPLHVGPPSDAAASTDLFALSLHDALPISSDTGFTRTEIPGRSICGRCPASWPSSPETPNGMRCPGKLRRWWKRKRGSRDRKSTRLNSSHVKISYAVFCLKKKKVKDTRDDL